MGYRDDFYIAANITGYSGAITADPTVYFQLNANGTRYFGRITQSHDNKLNIGRNKVRAKTDYVIQNQNVNGKMRCTEFYDGAIQHFSRNTFTPVAGLSAVQLSILRRAIYNFPEAKPKETASRAAKRAARQTEARTARGTVPRNNTATLLATHIQAIEDAQED